MFYKNEKKFYKLNNVLDDFFFCHCNKKTRESYGFDKIKVIWGRLSKEHIWVQGKPEMYNNLFGAIQEEIDRHKGQDFSFHYSITTPTKLKAILYTQKVVEEVIECFREKGYEVSIFGAVKKDFTAFFVDYERLNYHFIISRRV